MDKGKKTVGQPTRRFVADDLRNPKTLRHMRSRMGLTQKEMILSLGGRDLRKYQKWEQDGMNQVSDLLRCYVLLKFDMFLISEKHNIGLAWGPGEDGAGLGRGKK